ncbi:MAG: hypothetical protein ACI9N9_000106 [Enterobacterales bacterium]|jgi:hypothetical protein
MIYELEFYIDTVQVFPDEWELIGVQGDYTVSYNDVRLTVDTLDFSGDSKDLILARIDQDGEHVAIECIASVGSIEIPFVILPNQGAVYTDDAITMPIEQKTSLDWLMRKLNSKTWIELNDETTITGGFDVLFIVIDDDIVGKLATLSITELSALFALFDSIAGLANAIAQASGGVLGFTVTASMIAIEIIRLILVVTQLVVTTKKIFKLFFPKIRKLRANKWQSLIEQAVASQDYTLSSTLMDSYSNATIVPVPMQVGNQSIWDVIIGDSIEYYNNDFPAALDSIPYCGDVITEAINWLNAEPRIIGNVFHLESKEFWTTTASQTAESTLNNQDVRINEHTFNSDDAWKTKTMAYRTDQSDINTLDDINGLNAGYRTIHTGSAPNELVDITGTVLIDSVFSLGKRKPKLNVQEVEALLIAQEIDEVITQMGFSSTLAANISGSPGVLQISQQQFTVTKLLNVVAGRQTTNYLQVIGAKAIYGANHTGDQVKENYSKIEVMDIPFSPTQFFQFHTNNYIFGSDGSELEVLRYKWMTGSVEMNIETAKKVPELSRTSTVEDYG